MKDKERYFKALKENNRSLNEIDLGELLGFNEDEIQNLLSMLLAEFKVEYSVNRNCNYSVVKSKKRNRL
ncbi:hypothetical protein [uncultured Maribacter sp.]|uniref:hypothetical protein n=1 Tax=uncultured Maribacter sp. TaxID=431308 RepID=UPI0026394214|nr:hypothetical protein [uncultured Maribacter sp.]